MNLLDAHASGSSNVASPQSGIEIHGAVKARPILRALLLNYDN